MNLLFIGGNFSGKMESDILYQSKGLVHYAANKLQWNMIDGLDAVPGVELEILSAPFIGTFPKDHKKLFIAGNSEFYKRRRKSTYIAFCNLWGYRNISRKRSLISKVREFVALKSEKKVILVYSPHTPFLQAAVYAKLIDPEIHICLVVPDLPQYMNLTDNISPVYKFFKNIDIKVFQKNSIYIDSYVLLTESMKEIMGVAERPYIVVEGMVELPDEETSMEITESVGYTVVYTGTLHKKFGVLNLVEAFAEIKNPDVSLEICGKGDSEPLIKEYAKKDKRIHYFGQVSNEESKTIQKRASILVNPRQDNDEYTKYSFPSKNLEYLSSGVPVIAYRLKGIPDEYGDYINYVEDDSIESLKKKLEEFLEIGHDERKVIGEKARAFVTDQKNNILQSRRIVNMINKHLGESM